MKDIIIRPDKRYLVVSKSTSFLEKMRQIISAKLNIGDVSDTKSHKNSMAFETIVMNDGGFIKFFLYSGGNLIRCEYDIVLADSMLYADEYSTLRSKCLLAQIIAITDSINIDDIIDYLEVKPPVGVKIKNRQFSHKNFADYGNCGHCGAMVYSYDNICPICGAELDWSMTKAEVINSCMKYGERNEEVGTNAMYCDQNWYNPYYSLMQTFSIKEISAMNDDELDNLLKLAKAISTGLY